MQKIIVAVLAHQEERRIATCLGSLPLDLPGLEVHVVVNGSRDATAAIARTFPVVVHDWAEGGKSRSWNRFVLDTPGIDADVIAFVDGDAEVVPGSIEALVQTLRENPHANAASGLPCNGRKVAHYRAALIASHGLFGDLYALSGDFVRRLRASGLRLPVDLIGDDSLVGALAKTNLGDETSWDEARVQPCQQAGFLCEPTALASWGSLVGQYRRMINYALRHQQNQMVSAIMRSKGPGGLPDRMAMLYPEWLERLAPRKHPLWWWFDRQALIRMRLASS